MTATARFARTAIFVRPKLSLYGKYVWALVGLVLIVFFISGAVSVVFVYRDLETGETAKKKVSERKDWASKTVLPAIDAFLADRIVGRIKKIRSLPPGTPASERHVDFARILKEELSIVSVAWIDEGGKEQLWVSRVHPNRHASSEDYSVHRHVAEAMKHGVGLSDVAFYARSGPVIAVAVRGNQGVVIAEVDAQVISEIVAAQPFPSGGFAYAIDRNHDVVAHPSVDIVLARTKEADLRRTAVEIGVPRRFGGGSLASDASLSTAISDFAKLIDTALAYVLDLTVGRSDIRSEVVHETLGWRIVVSEPEQEYRVSRTLLTAGAGQLAVLAIALPIAILLSRRLARRMVRPIQKLQEGAIQLGAGNFDVELDVKTGDELESLARQLGGMAGQLKERIDSSRLDHEETLKYQAAAREVIAVMTDSPTDEGPAFDAIAQRASRLLGAKQVWLARAVGDRLVGVAGTGHELTRDDTGTLFDIPLDDQHLTARAVLERRAISTTDTEAADVPIEGAAYCRRVGIRSLLVVPMLLEDRAVGALGIGRAVPGAFSDKQIALATVLADLAVVAANNAEHFQLVQRKSFELEHANRHKSEFIANMSHELRTPLNAILGFSQMLRRKRFGEINDKQLEYVNDIHSSGELLLSLINDILDLSKVEAGKMELLVKEFDAPTAINAAVTLVQERARNHEISMGCSIDPALGMFSADERKLKQIVLNLLTNAVKFTHEGGSVELRARAEAEGLVVEVEDTGIGIAKEDQGKVWGEFVQVGTRQTHSPEGTGLGLTLVKKYVELHKGKVWLRSELGRGATFGFYVPTQSAKVVAETA
jgi:signal transduction histidine kinase